MRSALCRNPPQIEWSWSEWSISPRRPASIRACRSGANFAPFAPNTLMPLSAGGLWLAETIRPPAAPNFRINSGTAGVGHKPRFHTSRPAAVRPAVRAEATMLPLMRESIPIKTGPSTANTRPTQYPTCKQRAGVTTLPTRPRMPSVPKPGMASPRVGPAGENAA